LRSLIGFVTYFLACVALDGNPALSTLHKAQISTKERSGWYREILLVPRYYRGPSTSSVPPNTFSAHLYHRHCDSPDQFELLETLICSLKLFQLLL